MRPMIAAVALMAAIAVAACQGSSTGETLGSAFASLSPTKPTHETFEGRFVDQPRVQQTAAAAMITGGTLDAAASAASAINEGGDADASTTRTTGKADGVMLQRALGPGVATVPGLQRYLDGLAGKLVANWKGSPPRYRILLSPAGDFPPHVLPDGSIVVPVGMVRSVESEDEIAFALAHELSHVILGHHHKSLYQELQHRAFGFATLGLASYVWVEKQRGNAAAEVTDPVLKAALANQAVLEMGDTLLYPSWTREQEDEADLLGTDLMLASGYNGVAITRFFERLQQWDETTRKRLEFAAEKYQQAMEEAVSRGDLRGTMSAGLAGLGDALKVNVKNTVDDLREDHRDAAARRESITAYLAREYKTRERRPLQRDTLQATIEDKRTKPVLAGLNNAHDAITALAAQNHEEAKSAARAAINGPARSMAYPQVAMYKVMELGGERKEASQYLHAAIRDKAAPLDASVLLAETYEKDGKLDQAQALLEAAWRDFGEDGAQLFAPMIRVYDKRGLTGKAAAMRVQCVATGDKALMQACGEAKA